MFIGIKKPPGKNPVPEVFYCGLNPAELRAKHAELVKANTDGSRFYALNHPLLVPLETVVTSREEHPDIVAAQKKREEIATEEKSKVQSPKSKVQSPKAPPLIDAAARKKELGALKVRDLQAVVERIKATGQEIETGTGTKAELVDAILKAEGLAISQPEEDAKEGEEN